MKVHAMKSMQSVHIAVTSTPFLITQDNLVKLTELARVVFEDLRDIYGTTLCLSVYRANIAGHRQIGFVDDVMQPDQFLARMNQFNLAAGPLLQTNMELQVSLVRVGEGRVENGQPVPGSAEQRISFVAGPDPKVLPKFQERCVVDRALLALTTYSEHLRLGYPADHTAQAKQKAMSSLADLQAQYDGHSYSFTTHADQNTDQDAAQDTDQAHEAEAPPGNA